MGEFDGDNEGNPVTMIIIGVILLALGWWVYTKLGADFSLRGRASLGNSEFGKKLVIGLFAILGSFFLYRGIVKLNDRD